MDISSLELQTTGVLHLFNPKTKEPLYDAGIEDDAHAVTITLASKASKQYRTAVNAMQQRTIKRGKKDATPQELREEGIELLASVCLGSQNLEYQGVPVQTKPQFRVFLSDPAMEEFKLQVDEALGNVDLFM